MASILVVSGPNEGDYYPLGHRTMVIGRQESCPIQITDDRVSRRHLQVRSEGGSYFALDMESANGVWVNGRQMETETELVDGYELVVGDSKIVFTTVDFPDRESAFTHYHERGQRSKPTIEQ